MKQIQFEHFRKAPHPFQQYGNLPPAALKNRSIPMDYVSLPQGQQAFVNGKGRKHYNLKYQSNFQDNFNYSNEINYQNDSLVKQLNKYDIDNSKYTNHKVTGKSLQTRDIEGAQGGSLKSPAVKYKQKAQQLKNKGILNGFDKYEYQKQEYKRNIQNAIKLQYDNDVNIGKFISNKGHGHLMHPRNKQKQSINNKSNQKGDSTNKYQPYLKIKYNDGFESKNQNYQHFFSQKKTNETQQSYDKFFQKLKVNEDKNIIQKDPLKSVVMSPYKKNQKINNNIAERQKQKQLLSNKNQIFAQNDNHKQIFSPPSKQLKQTKQQMNKNYSSLPKYKTVELQKDAVREPYYHYENKNYSKRSIQSQFRKQQGLGIEYLNNLSFEMEQKQDLNSNSPIYPSRKRQNPNPQALNIFSNNPNTPSIASSSVRTNNLRKFNPTNLSTAINTTNFRDQLDLGYYN